MRSLVESCTQELATTVEQFPWEERAAYADWLAQTYYYVSHSTRLLAAAAARFAMDRRGSALHSRFAAHIGEERKHEQLAIHDLKQLGATIEELPERPSTRMFYEPQYFKIEHLNPIALFGYILPLEAIGPICGERVVGRITAVHGSRCVAFLNLHAKEDVDHVQKALDLVATVPPEESALIEQNIRQTTYGYAALLLDIRRSIGR